MLNTQQDALSRLCSACRARRRESGRAGENTDGGEINNNLSSDTNPTALAAYYVRLQQLGVAEGSGVRLGATRSAAQVPFICAMWIPPTASQSLTCFFAHVTLNMCELTHTHTHTATHTHTWDDFASACVYVCVFCMRL